jgi:hypothetical protein
MAKVERCLAIMKVEMLDVENEGGGEFFVDVEAWLPHAQKLWAIAKLEYGRMEESFDQTCQLLQKA